MIPPTRPARGVTYFIIIFHIRVKVSTHTPRAGRDLAVMAADAADKFQPTRPVRGVTMLIKMVYFLHLFQPTRPVRGVTDVLSSIFSDEWFQPTRPVRGVT